MANAEARDYVFSVRHNVVNPAIKGIPHSELPKNTAAFINLCKKVMDLNEEKKVRFFLGSFIFLFLSHLPNFVS